VTKLSELPDGHLVAWDTETSGLYEDAGARISVVSWAYRDPEDNRIQMGGVPYDQGFENVTYNGLKGRKREIIAVDADHLPLGPKDLPKNHRARVDKWVAEYGEDICWAPNQSAESYNRLMRTLVRFNLVGHQHKFDLLKAHAGLRGIEDSTGADLTSAAIADTMLTQHVTEPRYPVALKPTAARLGFAEPLGLEPGSEQDEQAALKQWQGPSTDPRFDLIPWDVIRPYAMYDAGFTLLLHEYQQDWFASGDPVAASFEPHVRREFRLMLTLCRMEFRGVGYDKAKSLAQAAEVDRRMEQTAKELVAAGMEKVTPHGARKYFFGLPEEGGLGRIPYSDKMTKGGASGTNPQPQVDDEVISRLVKDKVPGAELYAQHEKLKSANAKWYRGWADKVGADGRLRMVHRQGTVISGRLAAEHAQLHAIPQPYQTIEGLTPVVELFHARPGHRLWTIDVSQAEIRIATAMAKCQPMLDQYLSGLDSHDAATMLMFGDELLTEYDNGPDYGVSELEFAKSHGKWHEYRQVAKRCNLGILYGAGVMTVRGEIAKYTGIVYPPKRVAAWIEQWRAAFPQFVNFLDAMQRVATNRGWVKLINGRVRYFSDYEPVHKAANQAIQGSQAEALKECMIKVDNKYPGILLLDIHDALWIEPEAEAADEVVAGVSQIMVDTFEQMFTRRWEQGGPPVTVPFAVDAKPVGSLEHAA
jgi:DNA polymerase I-like protein with 3'-5' exonuclease and polymerase domains